MEDQIEQLRESAKDHGMSEAFVEWFISKKADSCGCFNFLTMSIMWEGWKGAVETALEIMKKD